eukprot:9145222-Alexandrium_andersonii.AAC.1
MARSQRKLRPDHRRTAILCDRPPAEAAPSLETALRERDRFARKRADVCAQMPVPPREMKDNVLHRD